MRTRTLLALVVAAAAATPALAANTFVNCNLKGTEKMSPEQASKVFFTRLANKGGGNGGETVNLLVDLATGNNVLTSVKRNGTETTPGTLTVQLPDGTLLNLGSWFPESDPHAQNLP